MRSLSIYKQDYYNRNPYDFSDNRYKIEYINDNQPTLGLSDISAHLPLLEFMARQCNHVTEFGVRDGFSTVALLSGKPKTLHSYDLYPHTLRIDPRSITTNWIFRIQDTADPNFSIELTDLLFIDTLHTFYQVEQELFLHHNKVKKWIILHDTVAHGEISRDIPGMLGISKAIEEFMIKNTNWELAYESKINNGLMILEKHD